MSQYNEPDKSIGELFTATMHNALKAAHNDTDTNASAALALANALGLRILASVDTEANLATTYSEGSLSEGMLVLVTVENGVYRYDADAGSGDVAPSDQTGGTGFWLKTKLTGTQMVEAIDTALGHTDWQEKTSVGVGTDIQLNNKKGESYGSSSSPISVAHTINVGSAVDWGFALLVINAANDPLDGEIDEVNVRNYGYVFTPNITIVATILTLPGGLIVVQSISPQTNQAPIITSFQQSGVEEVGGTLSWAYVYDDAESNDENIGAGGSKYRVIRYPDLPSAQAKTGGTEIVPSTDTLGSPVSYDLTANEQGTVLRCAVAPKAVDGTIQGLEYFSDPTGEIQAASGGFDPVSLNWNLLLIPSITLSPNADIISGEIQRWGDRANDLNCSAQQSTFRVPLVTNVANGKEAGDWDNSGSQGRRLQVAGNALIDISGSNLLEVYVIQVDAISAAVALVSRLNTGTSDDGWKVTIDPGTTGKADIKITCDYSVDPFYYYPDALTLGQLEYLKIKLVSGTLQVFVNGIEISEVGSTTTGISIPNTYDGDPLYMNIGRDLEAPYWHMYAMKQGTITPQEETDLEIWLANEFGVTT